MELKIGIIQPNTWQNDLQANFDTCQEMIVKAARRGAHIICTPECALDGYAFDTKLFQADPSRYCVKPGSRYWNAFSELAKELSVYMIIGMSLLEPSRHQESPVYRNAAILFTPDAREPGRYYKAHSTYGNFEASFYTHGESFDVFPVTTSKGTCTIGIMTCYDRQMPETARMLRVRGAEVIFNPAATGNMKRGWNTRLLQTRAYENKCFVVTVNHAAPRINGRSLICDPDGKIVKRCPPWQVVRTVRVDIDKARAKQHDLCTRRPSIYHPLLEPTKTNGN